MCSGLGLLVFLSISSPLLRHGRLLMSGASSHDLCCVCTALAVVTLWWYCFLSCLQQCRVLDWMQLWACPSSLSLGVFDLLVVFIQGLVQMYNLDLAFLFVILISDFLISIHLYLCILLSKDLLCRSTLSFPVDNLLLPCNVQCLVAWGMRWIRPPWSGDRCPTS